MGKYYFMGRCCWSVLLDQILFNYMNFGDWFVVNLWAVMVICPFDLMDQMLTVSIRMAVRWLMIEDGSYKPL